MTQLTGFAAAEMVRMPADTFVQGADRWAQQLLALDGRLNPPAEHSEVQLLRKDGPLIWAEVHAAPLRDSQGQVIGTVRAITDISERRQSREALRKSQAGLLLAQRIGRVGSWELILESRRMEWSAETYRIFDLMPEEALPCLGTAYGTEMTRSQ